MNDHGLMNRESGDMLALRGVDVAARITGLLAETRLVQKYQNDSDTNLELAYTFPLPVSGTLLSFAVTMGERHFQGEVIPRSQAEVDYEQAIGEGNSAFRLQEIQPGMYNATLGNVMPGEQIEISLSYAEPLPWNGKSIRYRLPTTIAPRYGQPAGMQPWQRPETSIVAEYPLSLTVTITGALAHSAIACPSHKVSVKSSHEQLDVVLGKNASMDRDFILEIDNDQVQSVGVAAYGRDTHIAMLTLLPPAVEQVGNKRDVVLVIDCSGSMHGDSLALAKEGVQLALGSLQADERFGIVAFGTSFLQFDKSLQPANRKNLDMARRWVGHLDDLGGTDIDGALALALLLKNTQAMDILLLTDGQDWEAGKSIGKAKALGVRIFSMGIGSAVAEDSVRLMADETGGACELITPTEDMSERIFRHFNRMRQPQMTQLDINWPDAPIWESRPARACFAGDAYTVFAALPQPATAPVKGSFSFTGHQAQVFEVVLAADPAVADTIVRVAAKQRLAAMAENDQQAWAVKYQLMTRDTDYLITVERAAEEKAADLPALQIQPQMLPAGWAGTSSVRYSYDALPMDIKATGVSDCIAFSCAPDYSHMDVPAVIRCRSVRSSPVTDNGYNKFIIDLKKLSNRKMFGGLPKTYAKLKGLQLPDELAMLFDTLVDEKHAEGEIVRAFYQAFIEHEGPAEWGDLLTEQAQSIVGNAPLNRELVEMILEVLNQLRGATPNLGLDRYDISAFLRKSAD